MQIDFPVTQLPILEYSLAEWDLEYQDGVLWVNSNEAGQLKPLNSTKVPLPGEAAHHSLSKEVRLLLHEELVITSPEIFCLAENCCSSFIPNPTTTYCS